jgi:ribose transport system permease protein
VSSVAAAGIRAPRIPAATRRRFIRRNTWTLGIYGVLALLIAVEKIVHPGLNSFDIQNLAILAVPLAFAAMGQAAVVLVGGIDLSIGQMMAFVNVLAANAMVFSDFRKAIAQALLIILGISMLGALTGLFITISRVPDIIVTLATSFIWYGMALRVMSTPGGGVPLNYGNLVNGELWGNVPEGLLVLLAIVGLIWLPLHRSRLGLSMYAVGSNRTAAFLSGVNVARTRIAAYALGGAFVAMAGLALTAATTGGDPNSADDYTLNSVAAVVMGGVSLAGGRGGMMGPIAAAFVLSIIGIILGFMRVDPNWSIVIQGVIVVLVVLFATVLEFRRRV